MIQKILSNKLVKYSLFSIIFGYSILMSWWLIVAGPDTVWKIITSASSGINDYAIFPSRVLNASEMPFKFGASESGAGIPEAIYHPEFGKIGVAEFLEGTDTIAFLIIKNDIILMEKYNQGYSESSPTLAFSMSKSILSMLIGAAIDDGYIQSVDQPVTDYIPELTDAGFDKVTIKHLLQMTSGMDYVEVEDNPYSLHTRFYYTNRLEFELLRLDLAIEPGHEYSYKTGDNALLGLILSRALGEITITQYTQERVWEPLGMEYDGTWNLDHSDGLEKTWCCLSATARDYAKLGSLYLNNGNWNGEQIIPADWVRDSTQIDTSEGSVWNYQYQWWLGAEGEGDFTAMGHLGQFIYVNTSRNLVVVRLGTSMGGLGWDEWKALFNDIAETIK